MLSKRSLHASASPREPPAVAEFVPIPPRLARRLTLSRGRFIRAESSLCLWTDFARAAQRHSSHSLYIYDISKAHFHL